MLTNLRKLAVNATMVLAAAALIAGCSNDVVDPGNDNETAPAGAPALPPQSTMTFDLNFFGVPAPNVDAQSLVTGKPSNEMLAAAPGDHSNWINAFIRALYVQLITYDALVHPVAAFALAAHSVPQEVEPGTYLWTYIFVDEGVEYSIFLYGTPGGGSVEWRMEVSTNNPDMPLDHFVWFDGVSHSDDTGYWQFYEPVDPSNGVASVRIDYAPRDLRVEINGVGFEDEGNYLHFQESATTGTIDFYDASEDQLSNITWFADGSGSITVPDYNNGEQACWDTEQRNTTCSQ